MAKKRPPAKPLKLQTIEEYSDSDIRRYFIRHESFVPYYDKNGNKRVGIITNTLGDRRVSYKAVRQSLSGLSSGSFTKRVSDFAFDGRMGAKFTTRKDGAVVVVAPRAIQGHDKSITSYNFYKILLSRTSTDHVEAFGSSDYSLAYNYFWQKNVLWDKSSFDLTEDKILADNLAWSKDGYVSLLGITKIPCKNVEEIAEVFNQVVGSN